MNYKNVCKVIFIFTLILILNACSSPEEDKVPSVNSPKEELSGTLTVTTFFDGYIDIHAKNFMNMHPGVDILVIRNENNVVTLEEYATRISTELMSGKGTDLVDLSNLDISRYAKSGLLCNLNEFMDNDAKFNREDYYNNVFEAIEYDNNLYAMPFAFLYDMVYVSNPMTENLNLNLTGIDGINYIKMVDIYEKAKNQHDSPQDLGFMPGAVKESFFDYEVIEFYDTENKTAWIEGDEFVHHLNITKTIDTGYSPDNQGGWYMTRIGDGNDDFMKSDFMFSKFESNSIDLYNTMIEYENILDPIPLLNSAGNAPFNTFSSMYAIPKNSQNKELAWEFLKYCISEKEISDFKNEEEEKLYFMMYQGWIPINAGNFYTSFRYSFENEIERIKEAGFDVKWKSDNKEQLINDTLDKINQWNLERNKLVSDFELWTLLKSDLENYYYYNLTTAEETAKIIQNKVLTYLNE